MQWRLHHTKDHMWEDLEGITQETTRLQRCMTTIFGLHRDIDKKNTDGFKMQLLAAS